MEKRKIRIFGKDAYLLGQDEDGIFQWLEAPSWDCGWYWGFGYIVTLTDNLKPQNSRDISSHFHAENFLSKWSKFMGEKKPLLKIRVFMDKDGWELSELFEQFYFLRKAAENFGRGKCHCADTKIPSWKKEKLAGEINREILPKVMARILEILSPKELSENRVDIEDKLKKRIEA